MRLAKSALLLTIALATVCGAGTTTIAGAGKTRVGHIFWENSLQAAEARAQREHKPILHLQMFGRLDDALC